MALFWGSKDKDGDSAKIKREHERHAHGGEKVRINAVEYNLADLSKGGMGIADYEGNLQPNQYFQFQLMIEMKEEPTALKGYAKVVRRIDNFLACKFNSPQPALESQVEDYLFSK